MSVPVRMQGQIPSALEGASAVLVGQSALLLSKPLVDYFGSGTFGLAHFAIVCIAIINFFNIAANWVSSIEIGRKEVKYASYHLFWDILILAILFTLTQSLLDMCGSKFSIKTSAAVLCAGAFYVLICALYIIWNKIEIRRLKRDPEPHGKFTIELLNRANLCNGFSILIAVLMSWIALSSAPDSLLYGVLTIWVATWLYVMLRFIGDNDLLLW